MTASDAVDGSSTGTDSAMDVGAVEAPTISEEPHMQAVTAQLVSISPSPVFQIHGVDAAGNVIVVRRQLKRRYVLPFFSEACRPCLIGIEPAPRLIIGRVNCRLLVIRCA